MYIATGVNIIPKKYKKNCPHLKNLPPFLSNSSIPNGIEKGIILTPVFMMLKYRYLVSSLLLNELSAQLQVTLHFKMAMSESQPYPQSFVGSSMNWISMFLILKTEYFQFP